MVLATHLLCAVAALWCTVCALGTCARFAAFAVAAGANHWSAIDCYLQTMWFVGVSGCFVAQLHISADAVAAAAAACSVVSTLLVAVLTVSYFG